MKKKAMALLLTAAMAASVLTGCGSGDGGSGSQASGSQGGGRRTPAQRRSLRLMERRLETMAQPQTRARKPGMTASTMWTRTGTSTRSSTTSS